LGLAFSEQNNIDKYDKAIDYFQKAIVLAKKHNVFYRIGFSYNGLAKVYWICSNMTLPSIISDYPMRKATNMSTSGWNLLTVICWPKLPMRSRILIWH
jgi:tetratricopeptide (TPR) repeat protein